MGSQVGAALGSPQNPSVTYLRQEPMVLFDDTFTDGFCGWEELFTDSNGSLTAATSSALTLGERTEFGGRSLRLQTNSVADTAYGSQCNTVKRLSYPPVGRGTVKYEVWFAYGSENTGGLAPRFLLFMIDEMYGGVRNFWKAEWRRYNQSGAVQTKDWLVSSTTENNFIFAGPAGATYTTDFPYNGNKGNTLYVALTVDLKNSAYRTLAALDQVYDLSVTPSIAPPVAGTDLNFNNGLNFMVGVTNRSDTTVTASWLTVSRARATMQ